MEHRGNPDGKEPWQMTEAEWAKSPQGMQAELTPLQWRLYKDDAKWIHLAHENLIHDALVEGKPIPPEVLADYPDLQKESNPGEAVPEVKPYVKVKLQPLADEAVKYDTFDEFETAFLREIKHGRYYHVTDNPNFTIDPELGPRDMSSMAGQAIPQKNKLMITSDLAVWTEEYKGTRQYVAIIDMSQVPKEKYWQVNRGFGNEFWVEDPSQARVVKVVSVAQAKRDAREHQAALEERITGSPALKEFYNQVKGIEIKPPAVEEVKPEPIVGYGKRDAVGMTEAERIRRHIDILKKAPEKNAKRIKELEGKVKELEALKSNPGEASNPAYLGGWKPGDIALYTDFGLRSLYVVQIMEWPEKLGERFGTLTEGPLYLPPVMHDRSLGSVRAKVIDTTIVDWDFSWYGKVEEWNKVGTIHYYHYTSLYRNVLDLVKKEARILYPEVQQRLVRDLMEHPGWEVLKRYGLVGGLTKEVSKMEHSNPRGGTEVYVEELPKCDFCDKPAHYDGRTVMGPWAYMCEECFKKYGVGLGTGKGQRLLPRKALREAEKLRGEPEKELSVTMTEDDLETAVVEDVWYPTCPYCGAETPAEPDAHAVYCQACSRRFKIVNPFFSPGEVVETIRGETSYGPFIDIIYKEDDTYIKSHQALGGPGRPAQRWYSVAKSPKPVTWIGTFGTYEEAKGFYHSNPGGEWTRLGYTPMQERQLQFLERVEPHERLGYPPTYWVDCRTCKVGKEFHSVEGARSFIKNHKGHDTWLKYGGTVDSLKLASSNPGGRGAMDELRAKQIAEEAAVKASELTGGKIAEQVAKEMSGELLHQSPVSPHCERVLAEPPACYDFRGIRSYVLCRAWDIMEKEKRVRLPVGEAWSEARRVCVRE